MADWAEQYLAALNARDEVEKANVELYDLCARIADQKAELQKKERTAQPVEETKTPTSPPSSYGLRRVASPTVRPESPSVTQMRQDLTAAQKERTELQSRFEIATQELDMLKAKSKADTRKIAQLTATVSQLTMKLRDRDEELKGKAKLIENVQDENVTLNLQLNIADEQTQKLRKENQDLVDRWMVRIGKEADKMNEEGKFGQ